MYRGVRCTFRIVESNIDSDECAFVDIDRVVRVDCVADRSMRSGEVVAR